MFTIIGADGKEYGPVSADQVKGWITAGRANGQTKVKREGSSDWKSLADIAEFAGLFGGTPPPPVPFAAPAGPVDPKAYAADLIARAPKLLIGDTIGRSWELLKANFWPLVGVTLVIFLIQAVLGAIPIVGAIAGMLLGGVFGGGLYYYYLRSLRGQPAEFGDAFAGFSLAFVPLMLGGLVSGLLTGVGLLCLIIPGIYLAIAWCFTIPLIIDQKLEFWTAMEVSRQLVTTQWWRVFGLAILAGLLGALGALACGIGIIATLPIAVGSFVVAYETLCNPRSRAGAQTVTVNPMAPAATTTVPSAKAGQLQAIIGQLFSNPSVALMDRVTESVMDSSDPAVTDLLLNLLGHSNPGFRGLAIQSLGLVCDPRALPAVFHAYETTGGVYDHQQRAALSISNLVVNGRDRNPAAIAYLMKIFENHGMPVGVRAQAVMALCQFRQSDPKVAEFLLKMKEHPDPSIRMAAF